MPDGLATPTSTTFSCLERNGRNCRIPLGNKTWLNYIHGIFVWDTVNDRVLANGVDWYSESVNVPAPIQWTNNGLSYSSEKEPMR